MTRIAHFDLVGGVAGDMLLAGLIDAGADAESVFAGLKAIGIAHRDPSIETVVRGGVRALHLRGTPVTGQAPRTLAEVLGVVHRAALPADVTRRAEAVFRRLVEAESRAHGEPIDGVHLHEAGDDDAIFDVVGVILALRALGVDEVTSSAVPLGGGRSRSGFPWPGPATLELLRDVPVTGPPPDGEATTPTGAALVTTLATRFGSVPAMTLARTGYGAGTRDSPTGVPNLLRVLLGEAAASPWLSERDVLVVEANVDDLSPQLLADASEALFAAGALDVWQTPIQMKRGRLGVVLSALATADRLDAVRTAFFVATTTLGVREHAVSRAVLERDVVTVEVRGRAVRIKRGWLDGRVVTAMPEHADLVDLAAATGVA
ncbi:MAG TPA: nickel pincer cofactor biosynthesis protein LarC, partial [Candidatus Limnocylindrales bacterium]|nr:nickel pincer cofactor biosynthesis protein LarC [Candidatus Limnocylindrales bacterium]